MGRRRCDNMDHKYPKLWLWIEKYLSIIATGLTLAAVLVSIGTVYGQINHTFGQMCDINKGQDSRLLKLETIYSYAQQVDINTKRLDKLEGYMTDSMRDRASMNAKLDAIQINVAELLKLHTTK